MRQFAWLMVIGLAFCMVAFASEKVAALDGTSWKIEIGPDSTTKAKGEKGYKEVMTFADGMVTMNEGQKVGFASSPYEVAKSGEKDWTFKTEQESATSGRSTWTGTIHENNITGKLILTQKGGTVVTYTFKGTKLD